MARPRALTETQAREAAQLALRGESPILLAERYDVSERTIARVIARERDRIRAGGLDALLDELAAERR